MILPFLVIILTGKSISVCLKGKEEGGFLHLHCKVEELKPNVEIYSPDGNLFGSCFAPIFEHTPLTDNCDQGKNITQNPHTKVTTVVVKKDDSIYGEWTCKYGTGLGNDTFFVTRKNTTEDCRNEGHLKIATTIISTCIITALVVATGFGIKYKWHIIMSRIIKTKVCKRKRQPKHDRHRKQSEGEEGDPLEEGGEETIKHSLCVTCQHLTAFAFCSNCKGFNCEHCYEHHGLINPEHKIIQIEHIVQTNHSTKCCICKDKISTRVCITCETLFCEICSCNHEHKFLLLKQKESNTDCECKIMVADGMTEEYKVDLSKNNKKDQKLSVHLNQQHDIADIVHTHVCGFVFLSEDRIVVGDSNNRKLKIFQKDLFKYNFDLKDEPRGMALVYDNKIALTFPDPRVIKMFDIKQNRVTKSNKDIKLNTREMQGRKPFSIAYNQNIFAVEMGEREDGLILILTFEGQILHRIDEATKYAYFTGNTVRLALDKKSNSVFFTAMSKKSITCLDFKGNKKWSKTIPSPRGVFFAAGSDHFNDKLLVASRRGNAIYQVNCRTGKYDTIAANGSIRGPRYIAYNREKKLLYVHSFDENDDNYIVVFKYDIH